MRVTLTFVLVASESCFVVIVAGILVALFSGGIHPDEPALAGGTADPPPPSPVGAAQLPAVAPIAMPVSTPSISTGRPPIPTPSLTSTRVLTSSPSQPPVVVLSHCGPITASGTYEVDSDFLLGETALRLPPVTSSWTAWVIPCGVQTKMGTAS